MEKLEFKPSGVCSQKMIVEIEDNKIKKYQSIGGCPGNSLGIGALVVGMEIDEAIKPTTEMPRELYLYDSQMKEIPNFNKKPRC